MQDTLNFNVWHETTGRGHSNFITGGGGFLQNLVYGWVGFRAGQPVPQQPGATQLVLRPVFPPNITLIRLRRICYQQMALDITFVQQPPSTTVVRRMDPMNCATWMDADRSAASILLVQADGGSWTRLLTGQNITLPAAQEVGVWVFPGM